MRIVSEIVIANCFTDHLETVDSAPISDVEYPIGTQWVAWSVVRYRQDRRGVERNSRDFGFVAETEANG
jgi:hypothetical protein